MAPKITTRFLGRPGVSFIVGHGDKSLAATSLAGARKLERELHEAIAVHERELAAYYARMPKAGR